MEHICTRCAKLGLRSRSTGASRVVANNLRSFSSSRISCDQDNQKPPRSLSQQGRPLTGAPLKATLNANATSSPTGRSAQPRASAPLLRRTGGPQTQNTRVQAPGRLLQRTGAPRPGQGQLLTRKPGKGQQQRTGEAQRPAGPPGTRTDRRVRRLSERTAIRTLEEDDPSSLEAKDLPTRVDNYINTIVDPPVNPTTELPHTPGESLSTAEMRKDWPNTPLSHAGLVESVQQRIEWLSHRLPHGYQTPNQLAQHYTRGYLTRFESESERDEVLSISRTLAQKWADRDSEKAESGGVAVQPENMDFDSLADREGERKGLADTWVRGVYPEVKKQKMPFMDQIVRNLNNNGTVTRGKEEMFMKTVQSVLVSRQSQQGGAQAQKGIGK